MIEFDAAAHRFLRDGLPIPSVTGALKSAGIIDPTWFTEEARDRGTAVHLACEYFDEGDLDWGSVAPEYRGYVKAWERFVSDSGFSIGFPEDVAKCSVIGERGGIEVVLANDTYGFGGVADRIGKTGEGDAAVIDIKTGQVQPWTALQLAAYASCLKLPGTWRRFAVGLRPDGVASVIEYPRKDYRADFNVFLSALTVTRWKENK